jgi:hypothetical protein
MKSPKQFMSACLFSLTDNNCRTKVTAHTKVFQVIEGRNIPDWKKLLSVKENKQALINCFGDKVSKGSMLLCIHAMLSQM